MGVFCATMPCKEGFQVIKVQCSRCNGKRTLQALVWSWEKPRRETCHVCGGAGFVELDEVLWEPAEFELADLRGRVERAFESLDETGNLEGLIQLRQELRRGL